MWRLSTRLLAITAMAAVVPAGISTFCLGLRYQEDRRIAVEETSDLAESLAGEDGRILDTLPQLFEVVANVAADNGGSSRSCSDALKTINAQMPQFAYLGVFDGGGGSLCASAPLPPSLTEGRWLHQSDKVGGLVQGPLADDSDGGRRLIPFTQRIAGADGPRIVAAVVDTARTGSMLGKADHPSDAALDVIDAQGRVLFHDSAGKEDIEPLEIDPDLRQQIAAQRHGHRNLQRTDGSEVALAFAPLSKQEDNGVTVVVRQPLTRMLSLSRRYLLTSLASLILAAALAATVVWFAAARRIAVGVRRLVDVTKRLAEGDYGARVGRLPASVEINDLACNFDAMAETLQRRQSELSGTLALFESSTDMAKVGVFEWNLRTNEAVCNRQYCLLFGHDPDHDLASPDVFWSRLHPQDRAAVADLLEAARDSHSEWRAGFRVILPDGQIRWMLSVGRHSYDEHGQATRLTGVLLDVTDAHQAEEAMRRIQKMDALEQMTGGIAHDINNILGIISANLQMIEFRPTAENIGVGVFTSLRAVERGADLVRRLLAFSKTESAKVGACDIRQEIVKVKPLLDNSVAKSVSLGIFMPDAIWAANLDASEFGDALLNLVINANHALPKGGRVHIEVANTTVDGPTAAAGNHDLKPGDYVAVTVSDDGVGIPPEIIDKVFEPFFTTRGRSQGSGLGLSMVYGFVRRCGGAVRLTSQVGKGTTVRLYFPRAFTKVETAAIATGGPTPLGNGEVILLVDDEPDFLKAAEAYLRDLGYRTFIAQRPAEALALLGEVGHIDLLFSDVVMPGPMDGVGLANRLLESQPDLKVLLTTGYASSLEGRDVTPHPFPVLSKPYGLSELGATIRRLLNQSRTAEAGADHSGVKA